MEVIQQDAVGTIFRLTIEEDGTAVDVSTATTKQIRFQKPDGSALVKTATFTTTGTNGQIEYATVSGDLNQAGQWEMQGYIAMSGWSGYSSRRKFEVLANI